MYSRHSGQAMTTKLREAACACETAWQWVASRKSAIPNSLASAGSQVELAASGYSATGQGRQARPAHAPRRTIGAPREIVGAQATTGQGCATNTGCIRHTRFFFCSNLVVMKPLCLFIAKCSTKRKTRLAVATAGQGRRSRGVGKELVSREQAQSRRQAGTLTGRAGALEKHSRSTRTKRQEQPQPAARWLAGCI